MKNTHDLTSHMIVIHNFFFKYKHKKNLDFVYVQKAESSMVVSLLCDMKYTHTT